MLFHTRHLEMPEGCLSKMFQSSTIEEFQHRFETIANESTALSKQFLVRCFTARLCNDINSFVLIHEHKTLDEAIKVAQLRE